MNEFCEINLDNSAPIVTAAIHDGHTMSVNLLRNSNLTEMERFREEDPYTGIWGRISGNHIISQRSRFEFDLNRSPEKAIYILPSDAWGLDLWKKTPSGKTREQILLQYTRIYTAIYEGLTELIQKFGKVVILDIHSYNHHRGGPDGPYDDPEFNPEINIGTGTMNRDYWAPVVNRFINDLRENEFLGRKLDVRENIKFRGGYFPLWIHKNFRESACCISVEVKKFFMDEWSGKPDWNVIEAISHALNGTIPGLTEEIIRMRSHQSTGKHSVIQGITKLKGEITQEFIEEVSYRLANNMRVRRTLPAQGRLHIDRKLPFLCVYRLPVHRKDNGTSQLIKGEASYLIASAAPKYRTGITELVKLIINPFSRSPGAFLIIEIWSREKSVNIIDPDKGRTAPSFQIMVPDSRIPVETIEAIEKALKQIRVSKKQGVVSTHLTNRPWPGKMPPLLKKSDVHKNNCYMVGIEVSPIYRDPDSGEVYPLVLKKIHRGISVALKKGAFEFSRKRTAIIPESYKSLGRRAVVKSVWEVDQKLAEISKEIDFLMLITPLNIEQSWSKFKYGGFKRAPVFFYRPIAFDPSVLKRKLYEIPFDRIEDPALSSLFHEKLVELELKFSMIRDRNTRNFFFGSMQLYGEIEDDLFELAKSILKNLSPHSRETGSRRIINANSFAERAREEISLYRDVYPDIKSGVFIRDDITGLMVSNGNLMIGKRIQVPESRMEALIQHEVGTHVLTYVNGLNQPFKQLYCGLAGCDELQEGLAVLAEYLAGGLSAPRFRLLAGRVIAANLLIEGSAFESTFRELHVTFGFPQRVAYIITARIYRSGGFTKDAVYLRGFVSLLEYLRKGGELEPLLIGKISIKDISLVNELLCRKVLKPARLYPRYLNDPQSVSKLANLKDGQLIFNLI